MICELSIHRCFPLGDGVGFNRGSLGPMWPNNNMKEFILLEISRKKNKEVEVACGSQFLFFYYPFLFLWGCILRSVVFFGWGVFDLGLQQEEVEKKNGDLNQVWRRFENSENPCQGEVTHRLQYSLAGTNHLPP